MPSSIDDQVLDFYTDLFDRLFSEPFRKLITDRRRLNVVIRQVEDASDAASSSLTRFLQNQNQTLSEVAVERILTRLRPMSEILSLQNISNPNVTTEAIVETLLLKLASSRTFNQIHDAVYRLALHTVVQVLMQVGPVMAEWQKLNFSSTFELPRRVVNRLNEISDQINALGHSGQTGADERYEIMYRDYLLQRFHKVEAGTVRMTTSLDVDLRELFVMPRVAKRINTQVASVTSDEFSLMNLEAARKLYHEDYRQLVYQSEVDNNLSDKSFVSALEQVKTFARNMIVGLPGSTAAHLAIPTTPFL
jgi:hypothetical protein